MGYFFHSHAKTLLICKVILPSKVAKDTLILASELEVQLIKVSVPCQTNYEACFVFEEVTHSSSLLFISLPFSIAASP